MYHLIQCIQAEGRARAKVFYMVLPAGRLATAMKKTCSDATDDHDGCTNLTKLSWQHQLKMESPVHSMVFHCIKAQSIVF